MRRVWEITFACIAADIQQTCRVRNKDIRKFLDGIYVSERNVLEQDE